MDFPNPSQLPLFISSYSARYGIGGNLRTITSQVLGALTWTANMASFMPVTIPWPYPISRVWWINGSVNTTTNVDFGIYSPSGAKIYSTGSTAMGTISSVQYVTPATPFILPDGKYYFAWVCDNTTTRAYGPAVNTTSFPLVGILQQASALPLPNPATFAAISVGLIQVCGITRTASGF